MKVVSEIISSFFLGLMEADASSLLSSGLITFLELMVTHILFWGDGFPVLSSSLNRSMFENINSSLCLSINELNEPSGIQERLIAHLVACGITPVYFFLKLGLLSWLQAKDHSEVGWL